MLAIQFIRDNPKIVKASEKKRGRDPKRIDQLLTLDEEWRSLKQKVEKLRHTRNTVSEQINKAKKAKKEKEAQQKITKMRSVIADMKKQEEKFAKVELERNTLLASIGNILQKTVPKGKDDSDNVELKKVGKKPKFTFPLKDHIELGESLDLIDLETAAKNSGSRFYYLKNEAVLLSQALQRFAIDLLLKKGFTLIKTPFMLNRAALAGGVNLTDFEDTIYKIEGEDLYLIATSEHSLVALKRNQVLEASELPMKIVGVSTCFRKELGAHGRDDKGIFRVHEFNKVEEIIYCKPENSEKYFNELQKLSEDIFKKLGLPYRVVNICTGDLGNKQSLQYDIEVWFPGQNEKKGAYREVTSCSNCLDYQSVSLNTKYTTKDGKREYVHLLNNTALTDTRPIAAILENYQQKDGSVKIPKALWPYMNGIKVIKPTK